MQIFSQALGPFAANCYIIACEETKAAAVVDPGMPDAWIKRTLEEHQLKAALILLTHGHVDHIGGVSWVKSFTRAPLMAHEGDLPLLSDARLNGSARFGIPITTPAPDRLLKDGETIPLGNLYLWVLHTPGHSSGGICFYTPGHLIAGDTLFAGSIGRTDLPGGDYETLVGGIRTKLLVLPAETVVYPGHGETTTIGDEAEYNPFLTGRVG